MFRFGLLTLSATAVMAALAGCGGGQTVVRTADDASRYVDEIMRGADPGDYRVADDSVAVAKAAVEDSRSLEELGERIRDYGEEVCAVLRILIDPLVDEDSTQRVQLLPTDRELIEDRAEDLGVPRNSAQQTIRSVQLMRWSTLKDAQETCIEGPS